ncbi:hypothetical protein HII36_08790 [Nonomuraea sp. NN258]|uniref:hypothetical protein n=1 Tax=Nonomuraea antri TaxID=2730852 RepID=UPI00156930AC|nr:hypothetical protein [Nonomuraea antri]NRQ31935.1 hypothetical protein [Nonomuraea antri]
MTTPFPAPFLTPFLAPFLVLPVDADEGFPQAFRLSLGARVYTFAFRVTVTDESLLGSPEPLDLPLPGAFLVLTVARDTVLLRRKLVRDHVYGAAELALVFRRMLVSPANLNAAGSHGSRITGGVALRWGS